MKCEQGLSYTEPEQFSYLLTQCHNFTKASQCKHIGDATQKYTSSDELTLSLVMYHQRVVVSIQYSRQTP